jgi:SAM-dependent methyltransferase
MIDYSYHYRKWHRDSPEHLANMAEYYKGFLGPHLPADRSVRILDVGCGMGMCLQALVKMGYSQVEGVDMDPGQVASGRAKGLKVDLTADTSAWLRERAGQFDIVLATDVIEHIPLIHQIEFLRGVYTALKPGGSFLCTTPNASSTLASRYRFIDWTHTCIFTEHSLDFVLHHGGFESIKILPADILLQRPALWFLPVGGSRHYWAFKLVRFWRRFQLMAELGPQQGREVLISLNLLAIATKNRASS